MASGKHIPCGPCSFDEVTKDAGRWCTKCEEGLCDDCENVHRKSKSSRNHKVISIEDYRKIEHVTISMICEQHDENLEWFCKSHDEVLCVACVPLKHKACPDVIPIGIFSSNSRQSSALSDLEEMIEGTLRNVKQCTKNRESVSKELETQELEIKTMIFETRTKINCQLDKLQEKLLQELESTSHTCKSKYMEILQKLKSTEEMLTKLSEETKHMKEFSSDIQVFLGTRQLNKRIVREAESIKSKISATKDFQLKVSIASLIEKLSNDVEEFGKIFVSESATNLDFRNSKDYQAQTEINVATSRNISGINLQLIKAFPIKSKKKLVVSSCVILPNGHLLIANATKENQLIEHSEIGEHVRDIKVSDKPYCIAVIDLNRIVVTYGDASYLEIMNNDTFIVEKKIILQGSCLGISHDEGRLYVANECKIQVMDLSGRQRETFKTASNSVPHIKASTDRIFYDNYILNRVHCCHLNGAEVWQLKSDCINFPRGVTTDNYNNVYVVGYISNNLTVIQHDGRANKTLLTKSDGLNDPRAIDFDKTRRILVICNEGGQVAFYKVV